MSTLGSLLCARVSVCLYTPTAHLLKIMYKQVQTHESITVDVLITVVVSFIDTNKFYLCQRIILEWLVR